MHTLIYSSGIEPYLGDIDISSLLYAARQSNAEHKITGILLHINGKFIQVLEGEEAPVKKLYEIIDRDRRHKNLKILLEKDMGVDPMLRRKNHKNQSLSLKSRGREIKVQGL